MAIPVDEDENYIHDYRWRITNHLLEGLGYKMHWERSQMTQSYRYALIRRHPYERLGIFNDEQTARNMVDMLLTQARVESE